MLKTKDRAIGESVAGTEDQFTGELSKLDMIKAYNWYAYFCDRADAVRFLKRGVDQKTEEKLKSIKQQVMIPNQLGWVSRLKTNGCTLPDETHEWFAKTLAEVIQKYSEPETKKRVVKKVKAEVPDIQARTREASGEQIALVEEQLDLFYGNNYKTDWMPYNYYSENGIAAIHATRVAQYYMPFIEELKAFKTDKQVKEAYAFMTATQIKAELRFLQLIVDDSNKWADNKKKTRKPRKKKKVSATKQVSKVNYLQEYPELKLVSEDPVKIIGASQVWLYNTTSQQLIMYNSMKSTGLEVDRSVIRGYDTETSLAKRVGAKKAPEVLKRLSKGGKVVLRKLMGEINTKDIEVAGRISKTMIIVKVVK